MAQKNDSHVAAAHKGATAPKEPVRGPVTQKHRLRLGEADGIRNPNGVGEPSKESTIANGGRKGW